MLEDEHSDFKVKNGFLQGSAAVTQVRDNGLSQGGGSDDGKGGEGLRRWIAEDLE